MPFTEAQRKFFNAAAARHEPGKQKLADEADAYAKAGEELPPVKKQKVADEEPHEAWKSLRGAK